MDDFVGRGWAFPPRLNDRNRMAVATSHTDIRQSLYIIINTVPGERVMRPEFGCEIHSLIFAPANHSTAATAQRYVEEAIKRWEPRIIIKELSVTPGGYERPELLINITYQIKGQHDVNSLVYPYYLTPE